MTQQQQNDFWLQTTEYQSNGKELTLTNAEVAQFLTRGNGQITPQEVTMFVNLCKFQELNPFLNEAYLIKFGSQPAQIVTSKEAFMKRAEKHQQYEGFEAGIIVERNGEIKEIEGAIKLKNDILIGGWCNVYRKDRKVPIKTRISLEEFSKSQSTWKSMPLTMIRKTAIVNALREAFPETLGAMYTEEEGQQIQQIDVQQEVEQEIVQEAFKETIDIVDAEKWEEPKKEMKPEYARKLNKDVVKNNFQEAEIVENTKQDELPF